MAVNRTFDGALTVAGVLTPSGGIAGYVPEAPNDGIARVRISLGWSALTWSQISGAPSVTTDAPSNGNIYARLDGAWYNISSLWVNALQAEDIAFLQICGAVITADSIQGGWNGTIFAPLSLVGDSASPGNWKFYGTNGSGTKGYHSLPSGSFIPPITRKTSGYTATDSDGTIICTFSSDGDITLPVSGVTDGHPFTVVRTGGAGLVTVKDASANTLRTMNTSGASSTWVWDNSGGVYREIAHIAGS